MVYSRTEANLAFDCILDNVLGCGQGSLLKSALVQEGIDNIVALCHLAEDKIGLLKYNGSTIKLGEQMLLRCFLHYVSHRRREGNPIGHCWDKITQKEFDQFRIHPSYRATLTPTFQSYINDEFDLWGNVLDEEELSDLVLEDDEPNDYVEKDAVIDGMKNDGTTPLHASTEEIVFIGADLFPSGDLICGNTCEQDHWNAVWNDWNPLIWNNGCDDYDPVANGTFEDKVICHSDYLDEAKLVSMETDSEYAEEIIFIDDCKLEVNQKLVYENSWNPSIWEYEVCANNSLFSMMVLMWMV